MNSRSSKYSIAAAAVTALVAFAAIYLASPADESPRFSNTQLQINQLVENDPRQTKAWEDLKKEFFAEHPRCEFKGCISKGPFEAHHIIPVHVDRSKALDRTNLINLCRGEPNHHLWVGHQGNFREDNPNVREDAAAGRFPAKGWERYLRHEHGKPIPPRGKLNPRGAILATDSY